MKIHSPRDQSHIIDILFASLRLRAFVRGIRVPLRLSLYCSVYGPLVLGSPLAANAQGAASRQVAPKPTGAITALAFSPNGRVLAVGRYRTVTLLDVSTGRAARTLNGLEGAVTSIAFASKGGILAAASGTPGKDGQVELWDAASGRRIRTLAAHHDLIQGISIRADGRQLAAVSYDHQVSLWSLSGASGAQQTPPRYLRDHTDSVFGVAYSPNGRQLATAAADRTIKVWDTESGKRLVTFSESSADQYTVAYRPDGRQLAAGGVDKTLRVWNMDLAGGTLARSAFAHNGAILHVLYSRNGRSIFTCGEDNTVKEWDADTLAERAIYPPQPDWPQSLALSPNDKLLAVGRQNGTLALYDTTTHRPASTTLDVTAPRRTTPRTPPNPVSQGHAAEGHTAKFVRASPDAGHAEALKTITQPPAGEASAHIVALSPSYPVCANLGVKRIASPLQGHMCSIAEVPGRWPGLPLRLPRWGELRSAHVSPRSRELRLAAEAAPFGRTSAIPVNTGWTGVTLSPAHPLTHSSSDPPPADMEVKQRSGNESAATAQPILVPSIVTGVLSNGRANTPAPSHYYRFPAKKGQPLTIDVMARRAGSLLDSEIEVLDLRGKPIERAVLRAVGQTELTLRDADSVAPGIRLLVRSDFGMRDYVLAGREVIQIFALTKGPDDDYPFRSFRGQRIGYFGTTPEYHTNGSMAYKVEVHPPGSAFSPNGMPLTHLFYKNDDGGPLYSRDSYLEFSPPADGDYVVRLTDVRGQQGDKFTYKLGVHAPRPDFNVLFNPAAIGVPKDGAMVASLECERREGFDGEVSVRLEGLPTGFIATPGVIESGETAASLLISVAPGTENPKMDSPAAYRVVATATIGGREVTRVIEPDSKGRRVSVGAESKVQVVTDVREAALRPGGETVVEARITRLNGFKGRVPLDVRNLPYGVKVDDVGLNGVLITENETSRKFVLRCEPWVKPQSRLFFVTANVEGGVGNTALPLTLRITDKATAAR